MTLFDLLNSISYTKNDLSEEEDFEKEYNQFMINRFLSMDASTVLYANEASKMSNMTNKLHYAFLLNCIPKSKRFFKYEKTLKKSKVINNIIKYFSVNEEKANEIIFLLSPQQIKDIKKWNDIIER